MRTFRDPAHDTVIAEHGLAGLLQNALTWETRPQYDPAELQRLMKQWTDPETSFAMLNWYRASGISVPSMDDPFGLPPEYAPPPLPKKDAEHQLRGLLRGQALRDQPGPTSALATEAALLRRWTTATASS